MPTNFAAILNDGSTVANAYAFYHDFVRAAFIAAGYTNTSDTGQVNWGTWAGPVTTSVYEIFQSPSEGGLTPFYVKVTYLLSNNSTANTPMFQCQIGTGTNGAGTLTGFVSGTFVGTVSSTAKTNAPQQCHSFYAGSGQSNLVISAWDDVAGLCHFIAIERSRDSSGAITNSHVSLIGGAGGNIPALGQYTIVFGVGVNGSGTSGGVITAGNTAVTTDTFNSNTPTCPIFPSVGFLDCGLLSTQSARSADFAHSSVCTLTIYGASHTFLALKTGTCQAKFGPAGNANSCMLMLWE